MDKLRFVVGDRVIGDPLSTLPQPGVVVKVKDMDGYWAPGWEPADRTIREYVVLCDRDGVKRHYCGEMCLVAAEEK